MVVQCIPDLLLLICLLGPGLLLLICLSDPGLLLLICLSVPGLLLLICLLGPCLLLLIRQKMHALPRWVQTAEPPLMILGVTAVSGDS